jgi:hypothetical protein
MQLDNIVIPLDEPHLGSRLVEPVTPCPSPRPSSTNSP